MLGTVHHECSLTPSLSSKGAADSYARILRERQRKASEPKRTLKMLDVDQATANRLASGMGLGGVKARVSTFAVSLSENISRELPYLSREEADSHFFCTNCSPDRIHQLLDQHRLHKRDSPVCLTTNCSTS